MYFYCPDCRKKQRDDVAEPLRIGATLTCPTCKTQWRVTTDGDGHQAALWRLRRQTMPDGVQS